ncbi:hypothetical protein [Vulcanisaeta sp. JCM 14467]|uniref:hypothetical protein n=1 Tax=Vulcanisaeta sp. JCM 14467 TaxID=1295370 RepID=UPI002091FAB4|nr:hypothetical protein [Vulcanisaeta sp. JCM 14467]
MRTRRLDNLYDVVKEFNELWNEVPKNVNSTELRASLDVSVHVLGGYLIALANGEAGVCEGNTQCV